MATVGARRRRSAPGSGTAPAAPTTTPQFVLVDRPDEITHLVCCRSDDWRRTFCGSLETDAVNATAQRYCAMCVDEAESALPGWTGAQHRTCPLDGRRCPDDEELDARIAREARRSRGQRSREP